MRGRRKFVLSASLLLAGVAAATGVYAAGPAGGEYAAGPAGGEWKPTRTDAPALVAIGEALLEDLPGIAGAARDPYGTACAMPGADYCLSAPALSPDALVAAVGSQLAARGAHLERRDCPAHALGGYLPHMCMEIYSYRGVNLAITASDESAAGDNVRTNLHGQVLRETLPAARTTVPLGTWDSLGLTPAAWGAVPCTTQANGGCVSYKGDLRGPRSPEDARRIVRANLERAGYRVNMDRCNTAATGNTHCRLTASRFRALGAKDGMLVVAFFRGAQQPRDGFTALVSVQADNA